MLVALVFAIALYVGSLEERYVDDPEKTHSGGKAEALERREEEGEGHFGRQRSQREETRKIVSQRTLCEGQEENR